MNAARNAGRMLNTTAMAMAPQLISTTFHADVLIGICSK